MKALKLILKIALALTLLIVIGVGGSYGYEYYEAEQQEVAELSYETTKMWEWFDKYQRVQVHFDEGTKRSTLRRVNLKKDYIVYAIKDDDYKLNTFVWFKTNCEPNSVIVTTQRYMDSEPKLLQCDAKGDGLEYGVLWSLGGPRSGVWEEDLDGFKVYQNFSGWDFSVLDKEVTLSKAQLKAQIKPSISEVIVFDPEELKEKARTTVKEQEIECPDPATTKWIPVVCTEWYQEENETLKSHRLDVETQSDVISPIGTEINAG